jgi:hypothetical protein
VDFITGDFNMSLWQVCPQLRIQHPATTVLAWYGWKAKADGVCASAWQADCEDSKVGETAPVVAGIVQHRSDSCGIFSLRKPETVKRDMPDDAFENPNARLDEWVAREGFAIDSFIGGRDAVKLSLEEAPSGDAGMLPTTEKLTRRYAVDTAGVLFRSGAHKPLLVYVGRLPRVSNSRGGPAKAGVPTMPEG